MLNGLKIVEIFWKPAECGFTLAEKLYRIPCLVAGLELFKPVYGEESCNHVNN